MIPGTSIERKESLMSHPPSFYEVRIIRNITSRWILFTTICALLFLIVPPVLSEPVDSVEITANIPPVRLGDITVSGISPYGVHISWITDIPSDTWVYYDTVSHRNANEYAWYAGNDLLSMTHHLVLSGLKPDTIYYFRIVSHGPGGVPVVSGEQTFRTLSLPPTGGGGGGGGGGSYAGFFSVIPFTSPTTVIPTPTETTKPSSLPTESGATNITEGNWAFESRATQEITSGVKISDMDLLQSLIVNLWWILILILILLTLVLFALLSRRRRDD